MMEDRMKNGLLLALWAVASLAFGADAPDDLQQRIDAARAKLDAAARELAELHKQDTDTFQIALPDIESRVSFGVLLAPGGRDGVTIAGVTPGGPAEEAGIEAGDIVVTINGSSVRDGGGKPPLARVFDVLKDVNPGDMVRVEYLRQGEMQTADVTAAEPLPPPTMNVAYSTMAFSTEGGGGPPAFAARAMIGGLELFELNEDLGHYFGASSGVLVLNVPPAKDGAKDGLLPGDVLRSIDGRPVASMADCVNLLSGARNAEMSVEVLRDGAQVAVQTHGAQSAPPFFGVPAMGQVRAVGVMKDVPQPAGVTTGTTGTVIVGGSAKRVEAGRVERN